MINVVVCVKIIIDPEMPFSIFAVDKESLSPVPPSGMPPVINPYDENALEAALKIKDSQECKITVLSMGKALPKAVLQKILAVGADQVIAVEDSDFDNLDPFNTAQVLSDAIKKVGEYDLVFTGRQAGDWDAGLVWAGIAELLDIPSITLARLAEVNDGKLTAERCASDGIEVLETSTPALVTFGSDVGELRNVSLAALMKVKKQKIPKWSASDIGFNKQGILELKDLYEPDLGIVDCSIVPGETGEEKGRALAKKLMDEGIIQ